MHVGQIDAGQTDTNSAVASIKDRSLTWTYSLAKVNAPKLLPVAGAIALTALSAFLLFHALVASIASALFIFSSVAESFLPTTYHVDRSKVRVKLATFDWLEMPWSDVKSVYATKDGLKLSPYSLPFAARLEPYRGILLRYPDEMRQQIQEFVEEAASLS